MPLNKPCDGLLLVFSEGSWAPRSMPVSEVPLFVIPVPPRGHCLPVAAYVTSHSRYRHILPLYQIYGKHSLTDICTSESTGGTPVLHDAYG